LGNFKCTSEKSFFPFNGKKGNYSSIPSCSGCEVCEFKPQSSPPPKKKKKKKKKQNSDGYKGHIEVQLSHKLHRKITKINPQNTTETKIPVVQREGTMQRALGRGSCLPLQGKENRRKSPHPILPIPSGQ
jgi:hypothetical protein